MSELVPIADEVWTKQAPLRFLGVPVGTRMTVLRIPVGLVVHSPVPIDAATKDAIDALGTVRFVVAPNAYHHLGVGPAMDAWPDAKLFAVKALRGKRKDLRIDGDLEDAAPPEWEGVLRPYPVRGSMLQETALHHVPTKTLVAADLFENFASADDFVLRTYLKAGGIYGKPGWHRFFRFLYRNKAEARASVDTLLALEIEKIVVAHGDVVTSRARDTLREAMSFLGS